MGSISAWWSSLTRLQGGETPGATSGESAGVRKRPRVPRATPTAGDAPSMPLAALVRLNRARRVLAVEHDEARLGVGRAELAPLPRGRREGSARRCERQRRPWARGERWAGATHDLTTVAAAGGRSAKASGPPTASREGRACSARKAVKMGSRSASARLGRARRGEAQGTHRRRRSEQAAGRCHPSATDL